LDILIHMLVTSKEIVALLGRIHLFNGLNADQTLTLSSKLEILEFQAGEHIFRENSAAEKFYVIFSGEVSVELERPDAPKKLWQLKEDDYFGEDVLSDFHIRRSTARATRNTILLGIPRVELIYFLEENPKLLPSFRITQDSYEKLITREPSWIKPEEATRFFSRASKYYLLQKCILPVAWIFSVLVLAGLFYFQTDISVLILFPLGGLALMVGLAWLIWNIVDWTNDYYLITSQRVVYLEKVLLLYESRQETPLGAILSVTKQTSLTGRILGYADIAIRTYTGVLFFRNISSPDAVIDLLTELWERAKKRLSMIDKEEMEILLREKLNPDEEKKSEVKEKPDFSGQMVVKNGWIISLLASIFGMRTEDEASIIYRTHWFILLKKIVLPTFFLLFSFVLFSFYPYLQSADFFQNPLIITLAILTIIVFIWWLYRLVDWRNDYYVITKDQLVDVNRKPLGLEDRRTAPIKNIQTVEYKRSGVWGILFNFGTVFIRIGDTEFTFDFVHNPSQVQKEIFDRYNALMTLERKNQTDNEKRRMAAWMEAYHHIMEEKESDQT
jgi:uncharacterized membrane protein YdbT with pleckstrin-like domain